MSTLLPGLMQPRIPRGDSAHFGITPGYPRLGLMGQETNIIYIADVFQLVCKGPLYTP